MSAEGKQKGRSMEGKEITQDMQKRVKQILLKIVT